MSSEVHNHIYTAALIDGEGTITLTKCHSTSKFRRPIVSVVNTAKELIDFLYITYGGNIRSSKPRSKKHQKVYRWSIQYDSVFYFLEKIIPFLKEPSKKYRANLLITKYKITSKRNGKYSKQELEIKYKFEKEFFKFSRSPRLILNDLFNQ